jgi:formate hydrogenlyase transcriptional activator
VGWSGRGVEDGAVQSRPGGVPNRQDAAFQPLEDLRDDPESFGNSVGQCFYQLILAEGFASGCDLPLHGRNGVVGVLSALKRSESAFDKDDVIFLEKVSRQVAIAVENALEYERAIRDRDKETKQRLYLEEEIRAQTGAIVGESPALKAALQLSFCADSRRVSLTT